MKPLFQFNFRVVIAITTAAVNPVLTGHLGAQSFTNLHSFNGPNDDGSEPNSLILSGNSLFGTSFLNVFAVCNDGSEFRLLYNFIGSSDAGLPSYSGLTVSGDSLYGTRLSGGTSGYGSLFKINTNGTAYTTLHNFSGIPFGTNTDGAAPIGALTVSGNTLYGTASAGGSFSNGTVFAVATDGSGFTTLHSFSGGGAGAGPRGSLLLFGGALYGTAGGGAPAVGIVFKINVDGTGFTVLHNGGGPQNGLILCGTTLYGAGRAGTSGTVFKLNTDGTGFAVLHTFPGTPSQPNLVSSLVLSGNILYGATAHGGSSDNGTLFALNTSNLAFDILYNFSAYGAYVAGLGTNSDGAEPGNLTLTGNKLYGAAFMGGTSGNGSVFSLFVPPELTLTRAGSSVILSWPTNAVGFNLQSTTTLVPSADWVSVSPPPVTLGGLNVVTNPISTIGAFFRLSQ